MKTTIIGFIVNLLVLSAAIAEIYKWTSVDGQIHYGNQCPHNSCELVKQAPVSSTSPIPFENKSPTYNPDKDVISKIVPTTALKKSNKTVINPGHCLDSIADTLGKGQIDPYVPIEPVRPGTEQYRAINNFLKRLTGFWHGTMVEETCKGNLKNPASENIAYNIVLEIIHDLKGSFDFESTERGENNIVRHSNIKIFVSRDKLHAGETRGLIDAKRWAVKLLGVDVDELVIVRQFRTRGRQGGNLQQMNLRAYYYSNNKLTISEYYYTQDQLVRIRNSTLKR